MVFAFDIFIQFYFSSYILKKTRIIYLNKVLDSKQVWKSMFKLSNKFWKEM